MYETALLLLALAAPPKLEKIEVPKFEAPVVEWNKKEPGKTELTVPRQEQALGTRAAPGEPGDAKSGGPSTQVVEVKHAHDFSPAAGGGQKALRPIDLFTVPGFPARIPAFKSCLRLASKDRSPTSVRVVLKAPGGEELSTSRGDVTFGGNAQVDFIVDWEGFEARSAGDYRLVVTIEGVQREFPLPVRTSP